MAEGYSQVFSDVDFKRLEVLADFTEQRDRIFESVPEIKDIEEEIRTLGADSARAIIKKDDGKKAEIKKKIEALRKKEKALLKAAGYPETALERKFYCNKCKDTGFVNGKVCSCVTDEIIKLKQNKFTKLSPAPKADFESFDLNYYPKEPLQVGKRSIIPYQSMEAAYNYCKDYAANFTPNSKSLLLIGSSGLGKTHLACSIAKEVMEKKYTVMYASAQVLFGKIDQARYTEDDILTDILDCDLFILDDLGAETLSSYSLGIMYNIVNTRMIQNRPTIYTTNIASQNELSKRYGEKISSRILGTCVFLNFFGKDIRLIKSKRI